MGTAHTHTRNVSGVSLVEVIVGISILAIILLAVGFSVNAFVDARSRLVLDAQALYLAEEGLEITRALRNEDWNTIDALSVDTVYYFDVATTTLAIGSTPEVIDGQFYREVIFREVYRDSDDDIVASTTSGATVDDEIVEAEVSVGGPTATTTLRALIGNISAI